MLIGPSCPQCGRNRGHEDDCPVKLAQAPREETQETITVWALETFGGRSPLLTATRMNCEVAELIDLLAQIEADPNNMKLQHQVAGELADVEIILRQVAQRCCVNLQAAVNVKMGINRRRKWEKLPSGRHQHT